LSSADWQGCPSGPAAHRTRGCHTAGWQVLTCARSQLGFDAAIRIRVVVVCRNPRLEQHRGGRRVVVWWTRGLAVCAWLGSLFSVEGAVQKEAVVDTVMSQRGGLRCAQRSWRAQVPELLPWIRPMSFSDGSHAPCRGCCILAWPDWGSEGAHLWSSCDARTWLLCRVCRGPCCM
jgi:hypothetical protein